MQFIGDQATGTLNLYGQAGNIVLRRVALGVEVKSEEARLGAEQKTQTALLAVPPASSIVIDKAELENDDRLKLEIKKYFNKNKFTKNHVGFVVMEMLSIDSLLVKSISGKTFIVDISYQWKEEGSDRRAGYATSKIEKTTNSYNVISFDRDRTDVWHEVEEEAKLDVAEAKGRANLPAELEQKLALLRLRYPYDGLWSGRLDCANNVWYKFRGLRVMSGRLNALWKSFTSEEAYKFDGEFDTEGSIVLKGTLTYSSGLSRRMWIEAAADGNRIKGWGTLGRSRNCLLVLTRN